MNSIPIFTHQHSERLAFITQFIFSTQWNLKVGLTNDREAFDAYEGPKINYSTEIFDSNPFNIQPVEILYQIGVQPQSVSCFNWKEHKAFFKIEHSDFDFDIFAAAFFLVSRYEEWLPHQNDIYGRYAHENALAFKEGFLNFPLVDFWIHHFHISLQEKYPALKNPDRTFEFRPSYDIDMAWSFKNKGLLRNIGGMIKTKSLSRLSVLLRIQPDPYDCYDYLDEIHKKFRLKPLFFMLLAQSRSEYDKNINPYDLSMWRLMKRLAKNYSMGIHPSWRSHSNSKLIQKEKKILATATKSEISKSRQHYIKFEFPSTFMNLMDAGIEDDFSMGYGSINGFRASTAMPFRWFHLTDNTITSLILHPFCFMDANSFYEQKLSLNETKTELAYYLKVCKTYKLPLVTIFHNNFLGTDEAFKGWRDVYESFIAQVPQ